LEKDLEHRIEQYLRFPEELSITERSEMAQLLKNNAEARNIAEWLTSFYDEYDQMMKPALIKLSPQKYDPKISGPMVLAAMSPDAMPKELSTKATFASEEHKTLLRVLENTQLHNLQFHVLSKYIGSNDRVLIEIEDSGLELVTEKGGILKNIENPELSDINWDEALALVRVPFSSCSFNSDDRNLKVCDECTISIKGNLCLIQVDSATVSRILIDQKNEVSLYYTKEKLIEAEIDPTQSFTVHLYS
jgi:hypothetical protein